MLFPGLVALAAVLTGLQSTALPLVIEFSYSNEIEDRLLAPLPIGAVAVEKVVFAAMRACVAAAVMFPVGVWILGLHPLAGVDRAGGGGDDRPRVPAGCGHGPHPRAPTCRPTGSA